MSKLKTLAAIVAVAFAAPSPRLAFRDAKGESAPPTQKTHGDTPEAQGARKEESDRLREDREQAEVKAREARETAETKAKAERDERLQKEQDQARAEQDARDAEKVRQEAAAAEQRGGEDVLVSVPKGFRLTLDNHKQVIVHPGTQRMPAALANHWYSKANGVKVVEEGSARPAGDPKDLARAYVEATKKILADAGKEKPIYTMDYCVGSIAGYYHVEPQTVRDELEKRVAASKG